MSQITKMTRQQQKKRKETELVKQLTITSWQVAKIGEKWHKKGVMMIEIVRKCKNGLNNSNKRLKDPKSEGIFHIFHVYI